MHAAASVETAYTLNAGLAPRVHSCAWLVNRLSTMPAGAHGGCPPRRRRVEVIEVEDVREALKAAFRG